MKKYAIFCQRHNKLVTDWTIEKPSISFCPECLEKKKIRILEEDKEEN